MGTVEFQSTHPSRGATAGTDVQFYEPGGILALRRRAASRARIVPSDEK